MKRLFSGIAVVAAGIFALSLAGCGATNGSGENYTYSVTLTETEVEAPSSAAEMLARIRPTVVDVTSESETAVSAGSGVIIGASEDENTYFIVTNHHVIEGGTAFSADVLTIAADGSETTSAYAARLIGSSYRRDIAVLAVSVPAGTKLSVASFVKDSESVKVGTEVYAIGNPLGILGGTVTHGIVSATKRAVAVDGIGTMTLMQTDATINGGNSGGGLFDTAGGLVGIINSGFETYNGQSVEGLNFAIPANDASFAVQSLIATYSESGGVIGYGYVEGDARLDISFSAATLYTSSALSERGNYLIASAANEESPLYAAWQSSPKAVLSVSVNGTVTQFTGGSGSYSLTAAAYAAIESVKAGDSVVVEYRDILTRQLGFGGFGPAYYYLGSETKTATFNATQYIYQP